MMPLLEWYTSYLQEKQLPSPPNKTTSNYTYCRALGCSSLHLGNINIQFCLLLHISIHHDVMMTSFCTDQYCIRPSAVLGLRQWVEQCNLTMLGFQVCPIWHQAKIDVFLLPSSLSCTFALSFSHNFACQPMPCIHCIAELYSRYFGRRLATASFRHGKLLVL